MWNQQLPARQLPARQLPARQSSVRQPPSSDNTAARLRLRPPHRQGRAAAARRRYSVLRRCLMWQPRQLHCRL